MTPEAIHVAAAFSALSGKDVLSAEQLLGGSSNPSWLVTTPKGRYALRLYPYSDIAAYGQAELLRYLAGQSYPVPEVAFVGTHEAQHLLALSWVEGSTAAEALLARPDQAERFGRAFGEAHAQLHAVPVTSEMRAALQAVTPEPSASIGVLMHLDYHLLNVMMTDKGLVISVIDWENVRLGDARYDVARSLSILCADPSIRALPGALRQVVRRFRKGYLNGYEQAAGAEALAGLEPFLAWSGHYMLRDFGGRIDARGRANITRWTRWWQARTTR